MAPATRGRETDYDEDSDQDLPQPINMKIAKTLNLHSTTRWPYVLALLLVCACPDTAAASDSTSLPEVKSIHVGFGNRYKLGCWTPVEVTFSGAPGDSGAGGRLEIEAPDGDAVPCRFAGPRLISTMGESRLAYAKIGRADGPINVLLRRSTGDHELGEPEILGSALGDSLPTALPATSEFILELGAPVGLSQAFKGADRSDADRAATVVTIDQPQRLPDQWYGYEGVDVVVIAAVPAIEKSLLGAAQLDALEKWVDLGGTLLIFCGDGAQRAFSSDAPLARFAPG